MIGNSIVGIHHNIIIIDDERYTGIHGLWQLLTSDGASRDKLYTKDDLNNYIKIFDTSSVYNNNDPSTRKPKSSRGDKYMKLIAGIWRNRKDIEGSGFKEYKQNGE